MHEVVLPRKGTNKIFLFLLFFDFWRPFKSFVRLITNTSKIPGISNMDSQIWAAVLGDFLFHSWRTACKMYICLGDEFTTSQYYWRDTYKFGGFLPIFSMYPKVFTQQQNFSKKWTVVVNIPVLTYLLIHAKKDTPKIWCDSPFKLLRPVHNAFLSYEIRNRSTINQYGTSQVVTCCGWLSFSKQPSHSSSQSFRIFFRSFT